MKNYSILAENMKILTDYQRKNDNAKTTPKDLDTFKEMRRRIEYQCKVGYFTEEAKKALFAMLEVIEADAAEVIKINAEVKKITKEIRAARRKEAKNA